MDTGNTKDPRGARKVGTRRDSLIVIGSLPLPSSHEVVITLLCFRGAPASWYNHSTDVVLLSITTTTPAGYLSIIPLQGRQVLANSTAGHGCSKHRLQ